ncbi:hypothetical protein [Pseudomonas fluorescens]|uniref:hypothetical protein n=1 Tax=Pseudomonas fluorescens TaxID=294 RepID=UPI001BE50A6B|nr:hypothetical protein [Pseudomonas fluorescens]MCD4530342.1 hypothetical protein [Pseudomonas sp. C3-2018]
MIGGFGVNAVKKFLTVVLAGVGVVCSVLADESSKDELVDITVRDLSAIHQLIVSSHPGTIDQENKRFTEWVDTRGNRVATAWLGPGFCPLYWVESLLKAWINPCVRTQCGGSRH